MRGALVGIIALALTSGAAAQTGDGQLLSLTVEGEISPETEEALRRLLTDSAPAVQAERAIRAEAARLRQAARAAASETAGQVRRAREIEGQAEVLRRLAEDVPPGTGSGFPPFIAGQGQGIIAGQGLGMALDLHRRAVELEREQAMIASRAAAAQERVVSLRDEAVEREQEAAQLEMEAQQAAVEAGEVVSGVAQDFAQLGFSRRQFVLPANPTADQRRAMEILARDPAVRSEIEPNDFDSLHVEFVHPVEEVQTETTGTGEGCMTEEPGWPFDAERVAAILRFNSAVWSSLGYPAPLRSRLVVVDTGFDQALVESDMLRATLWADPSELLYARREIRSNQLEWRCVDRNRTNYYADVFGIGFDEGSEVQCQIGDYHERQIEPRRVCRRLQHLSRMEHHEQNNEQVFP